MTVVNSPVREVTRSPNRTPLDRRFAFTPFSLVAPGSVSFAAASQPFNATGLSISDSTAAYPNMSDVDFLFDLENGRYYWDGAERVLGDATDNGDGTYDVDLSTALDMGNQAGFAEFTNEASPTVGENIFSLTTSSNGRFEVVIASADGSCNIYDAATASFASSTFLDGGGSNSIFKRSRVMWNYAAGDPRIVLTGYSDTSVNSNAAANSLDQVGIGYRRSFGGAQIFGGTVHKVVIFKANKTEEELRTIARFQPNQVGVHWLGDSFLNQGQIRDDFDDLAVARGQYFFTSVDQVGSTSLTQQAVRHAANTRYLNQTLVIMDGGLTADDTSVTALTTIQGNHQNNRILYVQSNPVEATGVGGRPNWDDEDAAILAHMGTDKYLPTLATLQANGDMSANDNADIANDIIPRSLRSDSEHLNAAGQAIVGQLIYDRLVSLGWLAYTVKLTITDGDLTVDGSTSATLAGNGTAALTISGTTADVNTELASLDIANASAGSEVLTATFINPLSGAQIVKAVPLTIS